MKVSEGVRKVAFVVSKRLPLQEELTPVQTDAQVFDPRLCQAAPKKLTNADYLVMHRARSCSIASIEAQRAAFEQAVPINARDDIPELQYRTLPRLDLETATVSFH